MSEKQFKLSSETVLQYQIMDNDTDLNENEVVDLLNEQQATINKIKKARDESDKFIAKKGLGAEFLNWCVAND